MKKTVIVICIAMSILSSDVASANIFSKEFTVYSPNRTKTKVLVDFFSGQVTHIKKNGKWVKLENSAQRSYQNMYELQKNLRSK